MLEHQVALTIFGFLFIFLMTSLGSALVFFFKKDLSISLKQIFFGFAGGVMISASFFSLILPALESETTSKVPVMAQVVIGFLLGAIFLFLIDKIVPHFHKEKNEEEGIKNNSLKKTTKMFLAVTIHNIPEGLSVGIAFGMAIASQNETLLLSALLLSIGIGIQNFPEGAAVSLPFKEEGSSLKAFLFGMFSGLVEPIMAVIGFFLAYYINGLLSYMLSFAAGAMIYVTIEDLIPESQLDSKSHFGTRSFILGFILMMVLDVLLG